MTVLVSIQEEATSSGAREAQRIHTEDETSELSWGLKNRQEFVCDTDWVEFS